MKYMCRDCGEATVSGSYMIMGDYSRICYDCKDIIISRFMKVTGIEVRGYGSHYFFIAVDDIEALIDRLDVE